VTHDATLHAARTGSPEPADPPPVRVLYLIDSLGRGGAEHLMVVSLPHLQRAGVIAEVCALQERDGNPVAAEIRALGVPVRTLDIRRLRQWDAYAQVKAAVRDSAPAVVHTQLEFANVLGSLVAHRMGLPSLATLHTLDTPDPRSRDHYRFRLMAWMLRRYARRVIAVSESARTHHLQRARLRPEWVITLYNGIDTGRFREVPPGTRAAVRAELGIPGDAPLLVTVAIQREPKGIQHMLAALRAVAAVRPEVHYLLVGDGPHRPALEQIAAAAGIASHTVFAGTRDDIPALLAAADLFVLPSLTEALPTVIAEAMAAGLPVVATEVGGIPEMVAHGDSALLVPPADPGLLAEAVIRILSNPRQAAAMGRAGRRVAAERFDARRQAEALAEEYRRLARRGPR